MINTVTENDSKMTPVNNTEMVTILNQQGLSQAFSVTQKTEIQKTIKIVNHKLNL
jgi:hypothetical protein